MRADRSATFLLGDIEVDLDAARLQRGGVEVHLQPPVWRLLAVLASHPERVFARAELLRELWPGGASDDALAQPIRRLRQVFGPAIVAALPRRGYRLGLPRVPVERAAPARLSPPPDRLVGREGELAAVRGLLDARAPLVTLLGPGGVGKTRLAREIAASRDGVEWVDAEGATDAEAVARRVADALQLSLEDGPAVAVRRALASRRALLVLDNLEDALPSAQELLRSWLAASAGAQWLVTSRRVVGIAAEKVVPVEPLPTSDAVHLLRDRADAPLSDREAERLAAALDRLPLALELAARRLRVFAPDVLLERLAQPATLSRPGADRHGSVERAIGASWGPADADERRWVTRLAVFEVAPSWDAVEFVLADLAGPADVLEVVQRLVERSWLRLDRAEGRLEMLGLVRRFVRERADPAELRSAEERHGQWFARLGDPARSDPADAGDGGLWRELRRTWPDLLAACERALGRGDAAVAERVVLVVDAVFRRRSGDLARMVALLEQVCALPGLAARGRHVEALTSALVAVGRSEDGLRLAAEELRAATAAGDSHREGIALYSRGVQLRRKQLLGEAREALLAAHALLRAAGDGYFEMLTVVSLSMVEYGLGRSREALRWATAAVAAAVARGDRRGEAHSRATRALQLTVVGWHEEALDELRLALAIEVERDDPWRQGLVHGRTAAVLAALGRFDEAVESCRQAVALQPLPEDRGHALANLGWSLTLVSRYDEASAALVEAIPVLDTLSTPSEAGWARMALGAAERGRGRLAASLELLDRAAAVVEGGPEPRLRASVRLERALTRHALGDRDGARADLAAADASLASMGPDDELEQRRARVAAALA